MILRVINVPADHKDNSHCNPLVRHHIDRETEIRSNLGSRCSRNSRAGKWDLNIDMRVLRIDALGFVKAACSKRQKELIMPFMDPCVGVKHERDYVLIFQRTPKLLIEAAMSQVLTLCARKTIQVLHSMHSYYDSGSCRRSRGPADSDLP